MPKVVKAPHAGPHTLPSMEHQGQCTSGEQASLSAASFSIACMLPWLDQGMRGLLCPLWRTCCRLLLLCQQPSKGGIL